MPRLSIILPAKNEAQGLRRLLPALRQYHPDAEVVVVNDGSTDETAQVCAQHGVTVVSHPYSIGNGAAVKTGARAATGEVLVFMDADGQHDPADIQTMLRKLDDGYDMVVGARRKGTHAGVRRSLGNGLYNRFASWMTGFKIEDLTSGFRVVRADKFKMFLYLLPNGFSYPTTITMAFFRSAFPVAYVPINAGTREGKSKLNLIRDGTRFFIIIMKIGALFSPMRLFLPVSAALGAAGLGHYLYTFVTMHRFTNMSALLLTSALIVFLIGIVSEQVSSLHYRNTENERRR
jgi:glycosyltransferase involved in cell wall biosynthesis